LEDTKDGGISSISGGRGKGRASIAAGGHGAHKILAEINSDGAPTLDLTAFPS